MMAHKLRKNVLFCAATRNYDSVLNLGLKSSLVCKSINSSYYCILVLKNEYKIQLVILRPLLIVKSKAVTFF